MAIAYKGSDREKETTTFGMREARLQPETETIVNDIVNDVSVLEQIRGEGLYPQTDSLWEGPVSETLVTFLTNNPDGYVISGIDHRHGKQVSVLLRYVPRYRAIQAFYLAFGRPTGSYCRVAFFYHNKPEVWHYDMKFKEMLDNLTIGEHLFEAGEHVGKPFTVNDPNELWAVKTHNFMEG